MIFRYFRRVVLSLLAPLVLNTAGGPVNADTILVPSDHVTIQAAIDAASAGDEIVVAPATYFETIDLSGKAISLRSSTGPVLTIIDGSTSSGSVISNVSGEGAATIIEGFTVTGGNAPDIGGGILNIGSNPTFIDMIVSGNYAGDRGGGMYNRNASPIISDTVFAANESGQMGGGMFNIESSPTILRCRFTGNISNKGAGMRNYIDSHPTVSQSEFIANHAGEEGGGMDNRKNSNPTVIDTKFIGNTAQSGGGAIHNYVGCAVATGNPIFMNL